VKPAPIGANPIKSKWTVVINFPQGRTTLTFSTKELAEAYIRKHPNARIIKEPRQ